MNESNDIEQLARDAQLANAGISPEEFAQMTADEIFDFFGPDKKPSLDFEELAAAIRQSRRYLQAHYITTIETLIKWPETLERAYSAYAEALGVTVAELEKEQKQQALLNHILSMGEKE